MRKLAPVLVVLALAAPLGAQEADDPRWVVEELFRAMKAADADAMAALMHEDARLVSTSAGEDGPVVRPIPVQQWLDGVRGSTRELDERLREVLVHADQGLASVWATYDLFVDGRHSHCGTDAFHLVRTASGWRILEIVDTRRTEGCQAS